MAEARAPVILIAGGSGMRKRKGPDPLLRAVIDRTGIRQPTIAYVGAASGDDPAFRLWFAGLFQKAGAGEVTPVPLCGRRGDPRKAKAVLEASDLVFISGGDVEEGMKVLMEKEMTDFLRRLHRSGKLFFGTSAGAIMLSSKWVRWRNPDDDRTAELFPCLGMASILCDTHGEGDGWEELKALLALSPAGTVGYGIVMGTAVVAEPDGALSALGGEVDRFQKEADGVIQIESLVPGRRGTGELE
jgi:cyanophycinase-like exopeptidase